MHSQSRLVHTLLRMVDAGATGVRPRALHGRTEEVSWRVDCRSDSPPPAARQGCSCARFGAPDGHWPDEKFRVSGFRRVRVHSVSEHVQRVASSGPTDGSVCLSKTWRPARATRDPTTRASTIDIHPLFLARCHQRHSFGNWDALWRYCNRK